MSQTTACPRCGAALSVEDYQAPSCRFCGAVHAHVARAQEKVAVVQGLLGDANRNGIPDALEGMMGPAPMAGMGGAVHVQHAQIGQHGQMVMVSQISVGGPSAPIPGGLAPPMSPPGFGGPVGARGVVPPMIMGAPGFVDAHQMAMETHRRVRKTILLVTLGIFAVTMLIVGVVIFTVFLG